VKGVILVEGSSDEAAVVALAERQGVDLSGAGVTVVPMGGATNVAKFARRYRGVRIAGLCDAAEERIYRRGFEAAGVEDGVFVCDADLEDELIRALGVTAVENLVEAEGELRSLRTFQKQEAQQGRTPEAQLRRFLGTRSGRKIRYGRLLVEALDLDAVPRPLAGVLAHVTRAAAPGP
jgi:hypothetical protein